MAGQWRATPPPDGRVGEREVVRYDWRGVADEAVKKPNEWLMVDDAAGQYLVTRIREDGIVGLRTEGFRFNAISRKNRVTEDGTRICELWVTAIPLEGATA